MAESIENSTKTEENPKNISGLRLKNCRKSRHMTLAELAKKAGEMQGPNQSCSSTNISAIEAGRRPLSIKYAVIFGKILGVRAEYLLGDSPFKTEAEVQFATETKRLQNIKNFHYRTGPLAALQIYLSYMGIDWSYEGVKPEEGIYHFHMCGKDLESKDFDCTLNSDETETLADYLFHLVEGVIEQTIEGKRNG